jgi:ribonuclease-3
MERLQQNIGYIFSNANLLAVALTHPSSNKKENNQRLEFLGDSVLGLVVAELLYTLFPNEQEGELARRHAALVRGETLTVIATDIGLGDALMMSNGEVTTGGRSNASNLEDAMEALIGALYLDGGLDAAKAFIIPRWTILAQQTLMPPKDAKTTLQEWAQARGLPIPVYTLTNQVGAAHAPEFTIEVQVEGYAPASATANAKRVAEQEAARLLLETLGAS